jgi:hypothetical protein
MHKNLLGLLLFVFMSACSDDDSPSSDSSVSSIEGVWVHDIANSEMASDLRVVFEFSKDGNSTPKEVQIVIAKETPSTSITNSYLGSLASSSYTSVTIDNDFLQNVELDQEQLDSDGNELAHDVAYVIHVYTPESDTFTSTTEALTFSNNQIYQGKYTGDWGDNLFSSAAMSGELEAKGNNVYKGPAYISSDFSPAFGGEIDNGKFDITIVEGKITAFKYSQHAPAYNGGCPGIYTGSGIIDNDFTLKIDYIGDDCDGHHEDGVMTLKRLWKD